VHAEHADELRIARLEAAESHQRVGAGVTQQLHQLVELLRGIGQDHPAPGVDHRPLGAEDQLQCLLDLALVALGNRVVGAHDHRLRVLEAALVARDVLGNVDQDRPRATGARDVERLAHRQRQVLDVLHQEVVLDAGPRDPHRVAFLEGVLTDRMRGHLAAQDDHRHRVHVGRGDAGHGVGDPRAGGDQAHADPFGGARVGIGRVDRGLFMANEDVFEFLGGVQRVVDIQDGATGVAEDVLDALFLKTADDNFRAGDFHSFS
jgi:hypothetical protein